jgi:hypothetical protein
MEGTGVEERTGDMEIGWRIRQPPRRGGLAPRGRSRVRPALLGDRAPRNIFEPMVLVAVQVAVIGHGKMHELENRGQRHEAGKVRREDVSQGSSGAGNLWARATLHRENRNR